MAKVYRQITKQQLDKDGNINYFEETKESFMARDEPDFIKLYLDHVLVHKDLSVKLSPILVQVCKLANYADHQQGGMMIFLNSYTKEQIRKNLNYTSVKMVEKSIASLVNSKIIIRKSRGAYLLNPYYFGKGHWTDIKKIRATIDFNTGEFIPELEFDVRDGGGSIVDGLYQDTQGNIVNVESGEILEDKYLATGTDVR